MIINKEYLRLFSKEHNCMLMIPFNVKGIIFAKKKKCINFPKGLPASFDIQIIKLFSFEAYHVMILLDFFLLQLLTGLTLSDPHLSIILHVIRKILHHPFIFAKSCNFFSKMYSFLLQSNWNIYVLCHQMFESTQ